MTVHLRVQQIRPLMFAVSRHFSNTEADKAFRLFVSWSVRFLIYGGRGGMLDTQYSLRALFKQSGYSITNQVADCDKWTLDEIRDRLGRMAKIAVKTWSLSRPCGQRRSGRASGTLKSS